MVLYDSLGFSQFPSSPLDRAEVPATCSRSDSSFRTSISNYLYVISSALQHGQKSEGSKMKLYYYTQRVPIQMSNYLFHFRMNLPFNSLLTLAQSSDPITATSLTPKVNASFGFVTNTIQGPDDARGDKHPLCGSCHMCLYRVFYMFDWMSNLKLTFFTLDLRFRGQSLGQLSIAPSPVRW